MIRDDLSDKLIHLTRGATPEGAIDAFLKIVKSRKLIGGDGYIKGKWKCVCFTESPISKISTVLANPGASGIRYAPWGIMVEKAWIFKKGGRPVIYQPEEEYDSLPELLKYRHVTYNPDAKIDFTWEREWRVRTDELPFTPEEVTLVVPHRIVKDFMIDEKLRGLQNQFQQTGSVPPEALTAYPWHFIVLSDLGVEIPV